MIGAYDLASRPAALMISAAGMARRSAIDAAPARAARSAPRFSASARRVSGNVALEKYAPLSPMARANRPSVNGDAINALTENDPADSPKIVTCAGSPPKAAMFSRTQRRAAT